MISKERPSITRNKRFRVWLGIRDSLFATIHFVSLLSTPLLYLELDYPQKYEREQALGDYLRLTKNK